MTWVELLVKIAIPALLVFVVVQVSEKSSVFAALVASVPLVSVLSMMIMYHNDQSMGEILSFSRSIVWLVLPSLLLFLVVPWLIETKSWEFYPALAAGITCTVVAYFLMLGVMSHFAETSGAL